MVSQAELILGVITLWFLDFSIFLETVWVPLRIEVGKREHPQIRRGWSDFKQGEILRMRMEVGKGEDPQIGGMSGVSKGNNLYYTNNNQLLT